jgi:hypothetical protein
MDCFASLANTAVKVGFRRDDEIEILRIHPDPGFALSRAPE